jgi:hypothetical protein
MRALQRSRSERGAVAVVVAIAMAVLLGFLGFVLNAGHATSVRGELQNASDAAALAAARELNGEQSGVDAARRVAVDFAALHATANADRERQPGERRRVPRWTSVGASTGFRHRSGFGEAPPAPPGVTDSGRERGPVSGRARDSCRALPCSPFLGCNQIDAGPTRWRRRGPRHEVSSPCFLVPDQRPGNRDAASNDLILC